MIRIIIGAVLGALGAYAYASSPRFQRQLGAKGKKMKQLGEGFRLPLPSTVVDLPEDLEDMNLIDEVICDCAKSISAQQPEIFQNQEGTIAMLQLCAATELYSTDEVAWPPVPGDHPTIHQLWGVLGFRARRLVIRGELDNLCFTSLQPVPIPPEPKPEKPKFDVIPGNGG